MSWKICIPFISKADQDKSENNLGSILSNIKMWWDVLFFFNDNPTFIINLNQYQSLPHFHQLLQKLEKEALLGKFFVKRH